MKDEAILLAHGSGGRLTHELIRDLFLRELSNPFLDALSDAAVLPPQSGRLALTTDSYVIRPIFFPGGDIGKLAVCGTVNDLSMVGARPLFLTIGFILEEGLPFADLRRIVRSAAQTAREAGVQIVAGDTKVVDRGSADQVFINTAGVGIIPDGLSLSSSAIRPGDAILVSGTVGDHGIAVMAQREGLGLSTSLASDCAPLNGLAQAVLACGGVRVMRDPTRGGLATTLVELAQAGGVGLEIDESAVPVKDAVRGACELLGLDPLYVANEGKLVAVVAAEAADAALAAMQSHPLGRDARIIGRATQAHPGRVVLKTLLGVSRVVEMLTGEQLPRIC
ncbi:MAG: hydrogenase expression/formation protein HypE [Anaerolineae bacterium]|nr:hydrogenase expression/formation protein HypE [Anaerolineae bacterium]